MKAKLLFVVLALVSAQACKSTGRVPSEFSSPAPVTGEDPRIAALAEAQHNFNDDPTDEDNIIWLGRRLAYLERFEEAINVYTEGLKLYPNSYRLLRHRGHRYISTRQFDRAEIDLTRASSLVEKAPIEVEPDGQPNEAGVPRSNTQFNIYYHLGLARYLKGYLPEARDAYAKCLIVSNNDDLLSATTHWLYMVLCRTGRHDEASSLVRAFPAEPEILENEGYYALIQLYRGERDADDLLAAIDRDDMTIEDVTIGYGLVNWLYLSNRFHEARALHSAILRSPHKYAFGYIAAETDSRFKR